MPSDNAERIRAEYNRWHDRREEVDNLVSDLNNPWNRFVCENLPDVEDRVVLEIACGRGQLTSFLVSKGARVIGADISTRALAITRERLRAQMSPAAVVTADACNIPLADNSVDLVISCETVEHTPDPVQVFAEFYRVLKPDGKLILTFPSHLNLTGLYRIYLWLRGRPYNSGVEVQPIEQPLLGFRVFSALRRLNFRILLSDSCGHYFLMPGRPPKRIRILESARVLRRLLSPFGLHFGVIAERSQ
jgi:SAM-dependent methyltransferase